MADLQKEIDALDRVLFRLASVDDERLMVVLDALLPQLLHLFPASTATSLEFQLKDKILEVIGHIKTRLHAVSSPRLPIVALSALLNGEPTFNRSPFAVNFAFLFIEMGFSAANRDDQASVLATLARSLVRSGSAQQETFFRLLLSTFSATTSPASQILSTDDPRSAEIVLDFLLDVVLYQRGETYSTVAYGLMTPRMERLQRVKVTALPREALYECQLQTLQFVKQLGTAFPIRVLHYVAGAASFHHAVKSFSEDQLRRTVNEEGSEAALDDATLCRDMMCLILSSQVVAQGRPMEGRDAVVLGNRTRLADASILAATNLLKASKAAANVLPLVLQVVCQLMFGEEASRAQNVAHRIKIAGAQLCEEAFRHCSEQYLTQLLGPVMLPTLLRTLMDPNADLDANNLVFWREFRTNVYESLSVLASRAPALVTSSEQAFQVLLVRCLVEEKTRSGANALKAMNALRVAYETQGDAAMFIKIQSELSGLLRGTKLYDVDSNYQRLRAVVGEWAMTIIGRGSESIGLRFALLKLCCDDDEDVRRAANKALYAEPLPSIAALAKTLDALGTPSGNQNLQLVMTAREAHQCLLFLHKVINERRDDMVNGHDDDASRRNVVKYFVDTLLLRGGVDDAKKPSSKRDVAALYESCAGQLLQLHGDFPDTVKTLVYGRSKDIIDSMSRAPSQSALQSLATILEWSLTLSSSTDLRDLLESSMTTFTATTAATNEVCASLYAVGVGVVVTTRFLSVTTQEDKSSHPMDMSIVLRALSMLTASLHTATTSVSDFANLPRGEEALTERFDRLRSCLDAVSITGNWNDTLAQAKKRDSETFAQVKKLRFETVDVLRKIVSWKVETGVSGDGNVKQKLTDIRVVALDAIDHVTTRSSWPQLDNSALDSLLSAVTDLAILQDPELQFAIAHTLVSIGSCCVADTTSSFSTELVARIMHGQAVARQAPVRRSATVWLLCMCAAGLSSSSAAACSSWAMMFQSATFAKTIVEIHELFVTMLNDSDAVTTECAVKGLAYLRLKAPSAEIGEQFSDSLFRRLRCFRAFAPTTTTAAGAGARNGNDEDDGDEPMLDTDSSNVRAAADTGGATAATTTAATTTTTTRDTVENVAYREVSNVAADIGDPELMYSLLYLSTTNPIWQAFSTVAAKDPSSSTTAQSTFSFPSVDRTFRRGIIDQASRQWMSDEFEHRKKLIPWLFLLKHHSNSKVAEVMANLWNFAKGELVVSSSQEKSLLAQQWDVILQFLLHKLEYSRNFKYREACCLALVDLINGANAEDLESSFVRLWKLTSRSVDDIQEAVAIAGLKLFKSLGEASLRIASKHDRCRDDLLDYLISQGMVNKNVVCRALCIDLLLRLVKEVDASAIQDRLGGLILKLLEYLSSLEMPELQYAQFHVDKKDQLERLRVSLSQSGPVGQLLDQCTLQLKSLATATTTANATAGTGSCLKTVNEIALGVTNLLKFGVGLNTRVGTANYVATLATELPFELKKCGGAELILSRALVPYVTDRSASENDLYGDEHARYDTSSGVADALVLQSYLRAAAYLCALVEPGMEKKFVQSSVFAVHRRSSHEQPQATTIATAPTTIGDGPDNSAFASEDTYTSRYLMVSALATKELLAKCPPITDATTLVSADNRNAWYASDVFPAAYIGQFASSEALRVVWTAILEDLPPRITYSEAALGATLNVLARWIRHPSWDTRRQGVKALQSLFSTGSSYRTKITSHQTDQIWNELLGAVPGRLWRGKGVILEALTAIASVRVDEWQPLSSLILEESDRAWKNHELEYLESALGSLGSLATAMPSSEKTTQLLRLEIVEQIRTRFESWCGDGDSGDNESTVVLPPMMIKLIFDTLGVVFPESVGVQDGENAAAAAGDGEMLQWLDACVGKTAFHVWSVRRSVFATTAKVVRSVPTGVFTGQHTINRLIERSCGDLGVGDGKYSMVRVAAGEVLVALASRRAEPSIAWQVVAHRERMTGAVEVLRRSDDANEQRVAAQLFTLLMDSVEG